MGRQTIQEIYGDDDDNVGQELNEIIKRLKEKYGEAKKDREIATLESSKKASKLKPFYIALFYAIGLTALIFYFHKLGMFSQLSDHW